jgi:hypothetical protein
MAYASQDDIESILDEDEKPIPADAEDRLATNLEEATDTVAAYLGFRYADDEEIPGVVRRVTARVALRGFQDSPAAGKQSETNTMGPFGYHVNWSKEATTGDFYLTDSDEMKLDPLRKVTPRMVGHVPMWSQPEPRIWDSYA